MADAADGKPFYDQTDANPGGGEPHGSSAGVNVVPVEYADFWSERYKMNHSKRGYAIIINNKTFDPSTGMNVRKGTDVDAKHMSDLFKKLGFDLDHIIQRNDLTVRKMQQLLSDASKQEFGDMDCFACVILSHGEEGYVYGVDDKIDIERLIAPFKGKRCPKLAGKPKLFFIQACRGQMLDAGVDAHDGESGEDVDVRRIPSEADFLMAYSVTPGYYSWRNSNNGSWFIQAIAQVFNQYHHKMDVLSMMTRVNKLVAYEFESNSSQPGMSSKKQIPCITSMLTKDLFFFDGKA